MSIAWIIALGLVTAPDSTAAGPDQTRVRNVVRTGTDNHGVVDDDLSAQTGWRVARGFQWQIFVRRDDGTFRPARSDRPFATGQAFRLELEADNELWIYILNRAPDGNEVVLLPEKGEEHLLVRKGQRVVVPPSGQFRFQDPPGTETFRILASPERLEWVNPHELFRWENGETLVPDDAERAHSQKQLRSKAIDNLRQEQAEPTRLDRPLCEAIGTLRPGPAPRRGTKNTVVVAPLPEEAVGATDEPPAREQVVRASPDPRDRVPLVYDIQLRHRRP